MSKTTTYMVKGGKRERFRTERLARIPGVEISTRETRDLVKGDNAPEPRKKRATDELPFVNPASPPAESSGSFAMPDVDIEDAPVAESFGLPSQRPTVGIGIDAPAQAPTLAPETATLAPETATLAPETALTPEAVEFQPPWASGHPTPVPVRSSQSRQTVAVPQHVTAKPTSRQAFALVSYEMGSESVSLPGIPTPAHLPRIRVEGVYGTYDEAFAVAAKCNRQHDGRDRVYAVNAVAVPVGF